VWELAIKVGLGKLTLAKPIEIYLPEVVEQNGFIILPVTMPHALFVSKLPFHHKDPFDRLLIAQSLHEAMPIVGIDAVSIVTAYNVTGIIFPLHKDAQSYPHSIWGRGNLVIRGMASRSPVCSDWSHRTYRR
jgi:hypothetical protein